ncbi:MAG: cation:proton antiporter, partial [Thermodesulfobacteriota bacterium]
FLTGTEFIFIGLALGDNFLGLLDRETIGRLGPLFSLGLGYFGLVFGLQFESEKLRRFPRRFFSATAIQAAITLAMVYIPFAWLLYRLSPGLPAMVFALAVGAVACCSSPAMIALVIKETRPRPTAETELIRYIGGVDTVIGFTLFGIAACMLHTAPPPSGIDAFPALQWIGTSIVFGISMGFVLHLLTQVHCREDELWVFTIGIITFAGGVSLFFGLSPLFVNMIAGVAAANLPGSKDRVFMAIAGQEKPFYIGFLILAGAVWRPDILPGYGLAVIYLAARTAGKISGGYAAARWISGAYPISPLIGLGLLSQSGAAIAMAMDFYLSGAGVFTDWIVAMFITTVVANELISPATTRRLLAGSGGRSP